MLGATASVRCCEDDAMREVDIEFRTQLRVLVGIHVIPDVFNSRGWLYLRLPSRKAEPHGSGSWGFEYCASQVNARG